MRLSNKKYSSLIPVSIIVPMRNSETTVLHTLKSISDQRFPIKEIIVVDNVSSDNSIEIVEEYKKKSRIPINIIKRKENKGVGASYNLGVRNATSPYVIFMHSDSSLPTDKELKKLTEPLRRDANVVGSYSFNILPQEVWGTYNFWEKRQQVRVVGKENPGFNGKFDCVRRKTFLKIGGFDDENFGEDIGIGGEDADLYLRLESQGKIALSKAKVIHLHYLGGDYALFDWIKNRKLRARTYGRLIRSRRGNLPLSTRGRGLSIPLGVLVFLVKPILTVIPFLPYLHVYGLLLLVAYAFLNSKKMYTTLDTVTNPRIILLPFIDIFLVYYETFWMLEAFFLGRRRV